MEKNTSQKDDDTLRSGNPSKKVLPPAGFIKFVKVANLIRKRYLTGQMYNVLPFLGEEFLDSGQLGREKIQKMFQ